MTVDELMAAFDAVEDGSHAWHLVTNRLARRPDLHAMMLLDRLVQPRANTAKDGTDRHTPDMVASAGHDQVWLDVDLKSLAEVATPEIILDLVRCGVWPDSEGDCLSMFV